MLGELKQRVDVAEAQNDGLNLVRGVDTSSPPSLLSPVLSLTGLVSSGFILPMMPHDGTPMMKTPSITSVMSRASLTPLTTTYIVSQELSIENTPQTEKSETADARRMSLRSSASTRSINDIASLKSMLLSRENSYASIGSLKRKDSNLSLQSLQALTAENLGKLQEVLNNSLDVGDTDKCVTGERVAVENEPLDLHVSGNRADKCMDQLEEPTYTGNEHVQDEGDDSSQDLFENGVNEDNIRLNDNENLTHSGEGPMDCDESGNTVAAPAHAVAPQHIPGGPHPIEIVISMDTTGSMSSILDSVRESIHEFMSRLFMDIPNLKISLIAHGDYCDAEHFYVLQSLDFTSDLEALCGFIKDVGGTGGGDFEECYEYVLQQVRHMPWSVGTKRALVMIGDACPHELNTTANKGNIDWRQEADWLHNDLGVRVYAVQCQNDARSGRFWSELALRTAGRHLALDQFNTVVDILMAICYREMGPQQLQAYEKEVRRREGPGMRSELHGVFDALRDDGLASRLAPTPATTPPMVATRSSKKSTKVTKPRCVKKATAVLSSRAKRLLGDKKDRATKKKRSAAKASKIPRSPREVVAESKFELNKLAWSKWVAAMAPVRGEGPWGSRCGGGFQKRGMFRDALDHGVMYELAVQITARTKRYVVYACATSTSPKRNAWATYFLREYLMWQKVNDLIAAGCTLWVRRALISEKKSLTIGGVKAQGPLQIKDAALRMYDYIWSCKHKFSQTRRSVSRRGILLSYKSTSS